jgi:hypothetical protein
MMTSPLIERKPVRPENKRALRPEAQRLFGTKPHRARPDLGSPGHARDGHNSTAAPFFGLGARILREMKTALGLLLLAALLTPCAGQTTKGQEKPARKASKPLSPSFVCPDAESQKACKSYDELVKAKDDGMPSHGYVCFRKNQDDLFVISFSKPVFGTRWDADSKKYVIDPQQKLYGFGSAQTYRDGVQDDSVMPSLAFSGTWATLAGSPFFVSDQINFKPKDEKDKDVGVSIYDSQLIIVHKYQNKADKSMTYNLTIQRSTGRFSEYFQEESEKLPFIEGAGRCIFRGTP